MQAIQAGHWKDLVPCVKHGYQKKIANHYLCFINVKRGFIDYNFRKT